MFGHQPLFIISWSTTVVNTPWVDIMWIKNCFPSDVCCLSTKLASTWSPGASFAQYLTCFYQSLPQNSNSKIIFITESAVLCKQPFWVVNCSVMCNMRPTDFPFLARSKWLIRVSSICKLLMSSIIGTCMGHSLGKMSAGSGHPSLTLKLTQGMESPAPWRSWSV